MLLLAETKYGLVSYPSQVGRSGRIRDPPEVKWKMNVWLKYNEP